MEKPSDNFIVKDIFRRADKNDDDAVSWQEFKAFFSDGVLSEDELKQMFHQIDTHKTNNLDCGELTAYFEERMGAFKSVFEALEKLHVSVSKALVETNDVYAKADETARFIRRFFMRESVNQLSAVIRPVDAAADSLEEEAQKERCEPGAAMETDSGSPQAISRMGQVTPGRLARRAKRELQTQMSWPCNTATSGAQMGEFSALTDKLQKLIDKLDGRVDLSGTKEEDLSLKENKTLLLVQRKYNVKEDCRKQFRLSLRKHVEALNQNTFCQFVSVRSYAEPSNLVTVYEFWSSREEHNKRIQEYVPPPTILILPTRDCIQFPEIGIYLSTETWRSWGHSCIECLEQPEAISDVTIPASWWKRD